MSGTVTPGAGASAPVLSVDFETRSTVDLNRAGVYRYAQDEMTDVWCMAFAFDDEEPGLIARGSESMRGDGDDFLRIVAHVEAGGAMRAWNAQFERVIWNLILHRRYGFPLTTREQWVCTAAEAAAMSLPRNLGTCAQVLGLAIEKDDKGRRLMMQMTKPRKPRKTEDPDALLWWDDEDRRQRLYDYCKQDVRVERAVAAKLRPLSASERRIYLLDQLANDRGVRIDLPLVHAAKGIALQAIANANRELERITGGEVNAVTNHAALTRWLQHRDPEIDNCAKDTVRDLLGEDDLDPTLRAALQVRQDAGKSSVAKLDAMLKVVSWRSKARGLTLYHGAGTGRFTSKLIQLHNLPRGSVDEIERFIPLVLAGDFDAIEAEEPAMLVVSTMLRRMLTASPGCRLIAADYGQIEARVLAWIAEQNDLVELFATQPGRMIYKRMAAFIQSRKLGRTVDWTEIEDGSEAYQIGKNSILGAGYQLGWKTYKKQVKVQQGIDVSDEDSKLAIDGYREMNQKIQQFWWDINKAAIIAVQETGARIPVGRDNKLTFISTGAYLWCVLPSKRAIAYARPMVEEKVKFGRDVLTFTFEGMCSYTHRWKRHDAYGGLLTNNVVQAMARDLMVEASLRVEAKGYPYILSVHDEVVCDVPKGHGTLEEFVELMRVLPRWAGGLPVAADGWEGARYRK